MDALLHISDLSVTFGGLAALSGVSFAVRAGEIRAVIGPNGAGKTTLFNAITGFVRPTSGDIRFRDQPIGGLSPHTISARGVRRTFQNGGLFGEMTVLENVLAGLHSAVEGGVLGILLRHPRARRAERAAIDRARHLLDLMGIAGIADQQVKDLSGGQQRIVEIVRALATDPPLLLLDEPAVGLAPPVREQLSAVVRRLAHERGVGILLIEHAIDLVMSVSDGIVVLNYGQKIAEGPPEQIRSDRQVLEAYLGHG